MLTAKQRKYLKGLANDLRPTVVIGKNGLTENIYAELATGFRTRELVKVDIQKGSPLDAKETANLLAEEMGAEFVQAIGRRFVLYKESEDNKTIESTSIDEDDEPEYETFPLDGRTMDLLSLLHFVRFLDLTPDSAPIKMQILMAGKSRDARILYKGIDEEKFPGISAEKILLEMTEHGLMENGSGNEIYIWRSPGPDRRLLALETELSSGAMFVRLRQE